MNDEKVRNGVKQLRTILGLTQTELGMKIGRSLATIQRFESLVAPKGEALVQLMKLAADAGAPHLVLLFQSSLAVELGHEINLDPKADTYTPVAVPVKEIEILDEIFYLAEKGESPEYTELRTKWYEMTSKIREEKSRDRRGSLADPRLVRAVRRDIESKKKEKK
jgi:transcriptional regulator with XRE-family HTH domain